MALRISRVVDILDIEARSSSSSSSSSSWSDCWHLTFRQTRAPGFWWCLDPSLSRMSLLRCVSLFFFWRWEVTWKVRFQDDNDVVVILTLDAWSVAALYRSITMLSSNEWNPYNNDAIVVVYSVLTHALLRQRKANHRTKIVVTNTNCRCRFGLSKKRILS